MYLVGNWKMIGDRAYARRHMSAITLAVRAMPQDDRITVIHCPPAIWLTDLAAITQKSPVVLGAQDCHYEAKGAFTGDLSPYMLREAGCRYVIVGHSERRTMHHEGDTLIGRKARAAIEAGMQPILCVGESAQQRHDGRYLDIITQQLDHILSLIGERNTLLIAYEPMWAIGAGRTPHMEEIDEVCTIIRYHVKNRGILAPSVLYGGSVRGCNSSEILNLSSVDGVLVGLASTQLHEWTEIMKAAIDITYS
ncbi:MAG: triose-phosphate isomerase [Alphaproteobacteria bacterium]|nr:MAG: triose-phosphate isomerase [Alphaproteobacteria bacterium]TAF14996.1 MAG: triose-phosphate isomerase [Alphaproteobacteria bacterium]TAF40426.1 MAG: triose-phosphate isomerase [Alphaproteobacteria bacterium]TAF76628.1 MAG: triose-phosphate isomerase [Alphaproteobacteria bacterium]